jgi:hypothetical protein
MIRIYFWIITIFRDIWYDGISYLSYTLTKMSIFGGKSEEFWNPFREMDESGGGGGGRWAGFEAF